jgi:hypothetical protein
MEQLPAVVKVLIVTVPCAAAVTALGPGWVPHNQGVVILVDALCERQQYSPDSNTRLTHMWWQQVNSVVAVQ